MFPENDAFDLDSKFPGALPVVNHFLVRLQIEALLDKRLPPADLRTKVSPASVLMVLLRSLIQSKARWYSVSEWASFMLPTALGLTADEAAALNDDRMGRAIKALEKLAEKLLKPRCRLKKTRSVRKAVDEILEQTGAKCWIDYKVEHAFYRILQVRPAEKGT